MKKLLITCSCLFILILSSSGADAGGGASAPPTVSLPASSITIDASGFSGVLSSADDTLQKMAATLDALSTGDMDKATYDSNDDGEIDVGAIPDLSTTYQTTLVSGTSIKTVGGISLLGPGDVGAIGIGYGGTGATTAAGARTNLGLVIGTDVLAPNGSGTSLTGIPLDSDFGSNGVMNRTGAGTYSVLSLGVDIQAYDVDTAKLDTAQGWSARQDFDTGVYISTVLHLFESPLTSAPGSPVDGAMYVADNDNWDPATVSGSVPYLVIYDGASYVALWDRDGVLLLSSLVLPNANNPTTSSEGQIVWDSNNDFIEVYDGASSWKVSGVTKSETITFPMPDDLMTDFEWWPVKYIDPAEYPFGITLVGIEVRASTALTDDTYTFSECDSYDPNSGVTTTVEAIDMSGVATASVAEDDIDDNALAAGSWLYWGGGDDDISHTTFVIEYCIKEGN